MWTVRVVLVVWMFTHIVMLFNALASQVCRSFVKQTMATARNDFCISLSCSCAQIGHHRPRGLIRFSAQISNSSERFMDAFWKSADSVTV